MKKGIISFILLLFIPFIACAESYAVIVTVGVEYYYIDEGGNAFGHYAGRDMYQTFFKEAATQDEAESSAKRQCDATCKIAQCIKRGKIVGGKKMRPIYAQIYKIRTSGSQ